MHADATARKRGWFQFSIRGLLGMAVFVAIGCGALLRPSVWWTAFLSTAVILSLLIAILASVYQRGNVAGLLVRVCLVWLGLPHDDRMAQRNGCWWSASHPLEQSPSHHPTPRICIPASSACPRRVPPGHGRRILSGNAGGCRQAPASLLPGKRGHGGWDGYVWS